MLPFTRNYGGFVFAISLSSVVAVRIVFLEMSGIENVAMEDRGRCSRETIFRGLFRHVSFGVHQKKSFLEWSNGKSK